MSKPVIVRISPEWVTDPFWVQMGDDPGVSNYPPELMVTELGCPTDLIEEIDSWDDEYQAVYNSDDPANSGFTDQALAMRWRERGEELASRLAQALGIPVEFTTAGYTRVLVP